METQKNKNGKKELLFFIIIGTLKFLLYIPIFLIDILKA